MVVDDARERLRDLSARLVRLHALLLDRERHAYEERHGSVTSWELLQLLLRDEQFVWLRSLSTLIAQIEAPRESDPVWRMALTGGTVFLAGAAKPDDPALVLNRVLIRLHCDADKRIITIDQAEVGNMDLGIVAQGKFDYSGDPRLDIAMAGSRMTVGAMKRLWPVFIQPELRTWVIERIPGGSIDKITGRRSDKRVSSSRMAPNTLERCSRGSI